MITMITATIPHISGMDENAISNQFVVDHGVVLHDDNAGIVTIPLHRFYNDLVAPHAAAVASYFSPEISRVLPIRYRLYDITNHLDGSPHGSPYAEDTGLITRPSSSPSGLPGEIAVRVNMLGYAPSDPPPVEVPDDAHPQDVNDLNTTRDRPRQRRTGHVSLGSFNVNALSMDTGSARPHGSLLDLILDSFERLAVELGNAGCPLVVWSRANAEVNTVQQAWTDNAFDIINSRGVAPSAKVFTAEFA